MRKLLPVNCNDLPLPSGTVFNSFTVAVPLAVMSATPVKLPLTFDVPLNGCPQMVRAVCSFVALAAFPVMPMPHVPLAPTPEEVIIRAQLPFKAL